MMQKSTIAGVITMLAAIALGVNEGRHGHIDVLPLSIMSVLFVFGVVLLVNEDARILAFFRGAAESIRLVWRGQ